MFGVGFLSDETTETFLWLLGVFLESMHGRHPKVVFSDQCKALMNAIDQVFPAATHRLCQWHVNNNAIKHFGSLNGNAEFKKMWYSCMNRVESEEEFESLWAEMITKHVDPDHTWLPEMYTLQRRWACVFSQKIFTAGMVSTSRSEGMNNVLKSMKRSRSSLYEFVCAFEKIQACWRVNERAKDAACLFLPGQFVENNEMLTQVAQVYTRNVYKKFEYQCTEAYNVVVDWINAVHDGARNVQFKASRHQYPDARRCTITFNRMTKIARCSCHMWEGQGILCRHKLRVYQLMDVFLIPADLILKRWTKNAKDVVFSEMGRGVISHNQDLGLFLDFSNLMLRSEFEMVAASKTSVKAQEYLLEMMQKTKAGLPAALNAVSPTTVNGTDFQVQNPNKIKPKAAQQPTNNGKKPSRKRPVRARTKCPGISTRSRAKKKNADLPSFSNDGMYFSLSQPVQGFNIVFHCKRSGTTRLTE